MKINSGVTIGTVLMLAGLVALLMAFNMPVALEGSGVVNLNLLFNRQNNLILGGIFFIGGIVLFSISARNNNVAFSAALVPLGIFIILVIFLAIGLTRDPHEIPSPFIGKPAPAFTAPQLQAPEQQFSGKDMLGKVWLLNTWASWCVACRQEHPILMEFAKTKTIPVIGLDYKDQNADGLTWLRRYGDPYDLSITDKDGRIGIDFGVYGVPESFLIDKMGIIRYKQIGPVTEEALRDKILPMVRELQK